MSGWFGPIGDNIYVLSNQSRVLDEIAKRSLERYGTSRQTQEKVGIKFIIIYKGYTIWDEILDLYIQVYSVTEVRWKD